MEHARTLRFSVSPRLCVSARDLQVGGTMRPAALMKLRVDVFAGQGADLRLEPVAGAAPDGVRP
jgi:hypothetical protein